MLALFYWAQGYISVLLQQMMHMWANDLIISYSWWSLLLVFSTGLLFAALLYFRNKNNKLSKPLTAFLFILRFISISLITFLLLSPYIKTRIKNIEKPVIIVGIDNSASVVSQVDSTEYKTNFQNDFMATLEVLKEKNEVKTYLFGQQVVPGEMPSFSDGRSNYGDFLNFVNSAWSDANTGMLLLVGDGIYNTGYDPTYLAQNLSFPIVSIAMGDTLQQVDASIREVRLNSTAFLNDKIPVEITYATSKLKDKTIRLSVKGFGKTLYSESILIKSDKQVATLTLPVTAIQSGKQRIEISIQPLDNERNLTNNKQNKYLDVVETKQKILLLAHAPHPDISAITQSIKTNKNYELTVSLIKDFTDHIEDFDLVILHQIPGLKNRNSRIFKQIEDNKTPTLSIIGNQSALEEFNLFFPGVNISSASSRKEEATAIINPLFNLFTMSSSDQELLEKLPPLTVPLGSYQTNPGATVFSTQQIQGFKSDLPLVLFYENADQKSGAILGEGIWRWRIHTFIQTNEFQPFDTFILKSIQYLINRNNQRPFQIFAEDEYDIFDPVVISASYMNASRELVNTAEIPLTLSNEQGEQFQYIFSKLNNTYSLNLGTLPEGIYRYASTVDYQGRKLTESGEFVVAGVALETRDIKANHKLLFKLAEMSGGSVLYPNQINEIQNSVDALQLKSRIEYDIKLIELGTLPIILIIILVMLSLEWFLRKYFGTY